MTTCIYCLQESSLSRNRAHIIPECILQNDVVLPLGVECDACNAYASKLEESLLHHNRIWLPVLMNGVPGKNARKRKHLGFYTVDHAKSTLSGRVPIERIEVNHDRLNVVIPNPPQFNEGRFRRGLYHVALNYLAWKLGPEKVLQKAFDSMRRYVRKPRPNESWSYGQVEISNSTINKQLQLSLVEDAPEQTVEFRCFMDVFYMSSCRTKEFESWFTGRFGRDGRFDASY